MPVTPYREQGFDANLTSFAVVRTYPNDDLRAAILPPPGAKRSILCHCR